MKILVTAARGETGTRVMAALRARLPDAHIRALSRGAAHFPGVEAITGDMDDPDVRSRAVEGMDAVVHYGPAMHAREVAMGTGMIDAAVAAGVSRFVFLSVLHPEIDDLLNHQAKLRIEAYLINSGLHWTVLRPQRYFQNIDVQQVVSEGMLTFPYPTSTRLGHVDMNDLAEVAAKVVGEPGHVYATYDIAGDEHLTVDELAAEIASQAGTAIGTREIAPGLVVEAAGARHRLPVYTQEALHRLFGYYARRGIQGNANVLTWLLGRAPGTYAAYVRRCLANQEGPVGNRR